MVLIHMVINKFKHLTDFVSDNKILIFFSILFLEGCVPNDEVDIHELRNISNYQKMSDVLSKAIEVLPDSDRWEKRTRKECRVKMLNKNHIFLCLEKNYIIFGMSLHPGNIEKNRNEMEIFIKKIFSDLNGNNIFFNEVYRRDIRREEILKLNLSGRF